VIDLAELERAMWAGDVDALQRMAGCSCCCADHTSPYCPARLWDGCRSGEAYGVDRWGNEREWQKFYEETRGMSYETFFNLDKPREP